MVLELGWAALGALIGVVLETVKKTAAKNVMFKPALEKLMKKLEILKPLMEEVKKLNEVLSERGEESTYYEVRIKEGEEHVRKCSRVGPGDILTKSRYTTKLLELDQTLDQLILHCYNARDSKKTLIILLRPKIHDDDDDQDIPSPNTMPPPPPPPLPAASHQNHHDAAQGWTSRIRVAVGSLSDVVKESNYESDAVHEVKATLQRLQELFKEIETLNTELDLPDYEAAYYKFTIDNRVEVVRKWQVGGFKSYTKPFYRPKLLAHLNKDLQELVLKLQERHAREIDFRTENAPQQYHWTWRQYSVDIYNQIPTPPRR